jgi:23S rRNA pseudouridine1911/1915/1917 synthase
MSLESNRKELPVAPSDRGVRLDQWIVAHFPELSRARVQELLEDGLILLNGAPAKPSHKLRGNERILVEARQRPPLRAEAESIPLDVLYEDDDLLIVNKPAGMSVHAGAGNSHGTLVNALLGRGQSLSRGGSELEDHLRPGIVHRLDKETSGLIVIAKNDFSHAKLAESFRTRAVKKTYLALIEGALDKPSGKISFPIGRDPIHRTRMKALTAPTKPGKHVPAGQLREALTQWRKIIQFGSASLVEVQLHTGRTHQIRVHFSALKHPLVGDTLYGASPQIHGGKAVLPALGRQFLHAAKLGFPHPRTGNWVEARAPLPPDLRDYLRLLAEQEGKSTEAASKYL